MIVALPIADTVIHLEIPAEHAALVVRFLVADALVRTRIPAKRIESPRRWAAGCVARFAEATRAGGTRAAAEIERHEDDLRTWWPHSLKTRPHWLPADTLCCYLATGILPNSDYRAVIGPERLADIRHTLGVALGHPLDHAAAGCADCVQILGGFPGEWLTAHGAGPVVLWELYVGFLKAGWLPAIEEGDARLPLANRSAVAPASEAEAAHVELWGALP